MGLFVLDSMVQQIWTHLPFPKITLSDPISVYSSVNLISNNYNSLILSKSYFRIVWHFAFEMRIG